MKISTREDTRHVFSTMDWSKLFFYSCDVKGHTPNSFSENKTRVSRNAFMFQTTRGRMRYVKCSSSFTAGFSLLTLEVTSSHTMTQQSVGLLWTSGKPVAETST